MLKHTIFLQFPQQLLVVCWRDRILLLSMNVSYSPIYRIADFKDLTRFNAELLRRQIFRALIGATLNLVIPLKSPSRLHC